MLRYHGNSWHKGHLIINSCEFTNIIFVLRISLVTTLCEIEIAYVPYYLWYSCLTYFLNYDKDCCFKWLKSSCSIHRSKPFNEESFDEWVDLAEAPALPASLSFYKELKQLGFTIFLITGRSENQRNVTEKNLLYAGYSDWKRLYLR